jgi:group I intron endonuclease
MSGIVYHIFNTVNGKCYVGQTWQDVTVRWRHHKYPGCRYLHRAIQRYGADAFVVSTLTTAGTQEEMDAAEKYFIGVFHSSAPDGYNLREGGNGRGRHSEESKMLIGVASQNRPVESNRRIGEATRIRQSTPEARALFAEQMLGKANSPEARIKIGDALRGRKRSEEFKAKERAAHQAESRRVVRLDTGIEFESIGDAARQLGLDPRHISRAARGAKNRLVGGSRWRFVGVDNV